MEIEISEKAEEDLNKLPKKVKKTFKSKLKDLERNLDLGVDPDKAFDKYLSGSMHPVLQINLGRDHRAWFIEGKHIDDFGYNPNKIYCLKVLTKKEAKKLSGKIPDSIGFIQSLL